MLFGAKIFEAEVLERADDFLFLHPITVDVAAAAEALPIEGGAVVEAVDGVFEPRVLHRELFGKLGAGDGVLGDKLGVVENGPQENRVAPKGEEFEEFDGIGEVIQEARGNGDVVNFIDRAQVGEAIAEEETDFRAHAKGFLRDEALEVGATVGFDGGDGGGVEAVDEVGVAAFEGAELEHIAAREAAGDAHFHQTMVGPRDARIVEEGGGARFEFRAIGGWRGGPFAGEKIERVLVGRDAAEEMFKVGRGGHERSRKTRRARKGTRIFEENFAEREPP